MSYLVIWNRLALEELTSMWIKANANLRAAITKAAHEIDEELKSNADQIGESRPDNRRIHFVQPLGILFEAKHGAARILRVWDARRKR